MGLRQKFSVLVSAARGDSQARYLLAERTALAIHPDAVLSDVDRSWLRDKDFERAYHRFHRSSYRRTMDRVYLLDQLAQLAASLPGDTAECGVFEGLTSYIICRRTQPGKRHHAFDSFQGLSPPSEVDGHHWSAGDMQATEEAFRKNIEPYAVAIHAGWIPSTFRDVAHEHFSLVHVDVDLYEPTKASIEFFYPRMAPTGIMLFDDYGFENCPGARAAVDSFFEGRPERVLHLPTGQGLVLKGVPSQSDDR